VRNVISASRRTDLVASFPEWLAAALEAGTARVVGPSGRARDVDLAPGSVHTIVLWSKNYDNLLKDAAGLGRLLHAYDQVYCHFTITGLGGTPVEPGSPEPEAALSQIPALVRFAGRPERVSLRFDPLVFWRERSALRSNLGFFDRLAAAAAASGIPTIRMSFAQWYRKAVRRAAARGFRYVDPPDEEKQALAASLTAKARRAGLDLCACSQPFLTGGRGGPRPSSCVDGLLLQALHPRGEFVSVRKDRTQRAGCLCTESVEIGSYTQACPHGCVYCYANPSVGSGHPNGGT